MNRIYRLSLLFFCFFSYLKSMDNEHSYSREDPEKAYSRLKEKLGYDPNVRVFHHLRRLIFDHSQSEFGLEFLTGHTIAGYHHGVDEDGSYAYEFSVKDVVEHVYTFDFPRVSSKELYKKEEAKRCEIALSVADYIKYLYLPTRIELFAATSESISMLNSLKVGSMERVIQINFSKSSECLLEQENNEPIDSELKLLSNRARERGNKRTSQKELEESYRKLRRKKKEKKSQPVIRRLDDRIVTVKP